ncbi:MAG TPA: hypothetical protein VMW27_13325 [Thermoanaerobaculia bacterium]|nr:hypothetical protein [Thermoanaerobaculia bacterium]
MTKETRLNLILAGFVISLAIAAVVYVLGFSEWPGGMRPDYDAKDYDPRLTRAAATATPLITALERYYDEHSAFPAQAADFVSYIPGPPVQPPAHPLGPILEWRYTQFKKGASYVLSYKLGWDASLNYYRDGSGARWVFNPGDGSPEKPVLLKP